MATPTLNTDALTSWDNALTFLARADIEGEDQVEDENFLTLLINAASTAIARYTGRQFTPAETAETKLFRYDGGGVLRLRPYEARAVSSVVMFTDLPTSSQRTLLAQTATQAAEYRLEPREKTTLATYTWMTLPTVHLSEADQHLGSQVSIVGDWGIGSVPADVEFACLRTVAHWYRNPEGFLSRNLGELTMSDEPDPDEGIPLRARLLLQPYRV